MMMSTPKIYRARNLVRRLSHHVEHGLAYAAVLEPVQAIFSHDNGAVDDGAEVDRAQAHQVDRKAEQVHADEPEEQREWDRSGDHQSSAPVAEENEQDDDD